MNTKGHKQVCETPIFGAETLKLEGGNTKHISELRHFSALERAKFWILKGLAGTFQPRFPKY